MGLLHGKRDHPRGPRQGQEAGVSPGRGKGRYSLAFKAEELDEGLDLGQGEVQIDVELQLELGGEQSFGVDPEAETLVVEFAFRLNLD